LRLACRRKLAIPNDDRARELYDLTQEVTTAHGFRPTRCPTTRGPARSAAQSRLLALSRICRHRPGAQRADVIDGERHATATEKVRILADAREAAVTA